MCYMYITINYIRDWESVFIKSYVYKEIYKNAMSHKFSTIREGKNATL